MLLGGMLYDFGVEFRFWERVVDFSENQQISNMVITRIIRDVRDAAELLPNSNSKLLALKIGNDNIEYGLAKGRVYRKKNKYSASLTTPGDIKTLSLSYPAANMIEIKTDNFTTRVCLRN